MTLHAVNGPLTADNVTLTAVSVPLSAIRETLHAVRETVSRCSVPLCRVSAAVDADNVSLHACNGFLTACSAFRTAVNAPLHRVSGPRTAGNVSRTADDEALHAASGTMAAVRVVRIACNEAPEPSNDNAQVGIYDLANLAAPVLKYQFTVNGRKASAAAITNFTDGTTEKVLLATYDYDPRYMRFFLANYSAVNGNTNPFTQIYHYKGTALDGDQYQNFALVTSTSNVIYLLGFREDEELHVFEVQSTRNPFTITGLVKRATYKDWSGSDWRYGLGLQIVVIRSTRVIRLDGTIDHGIF
jgi:hypothetical protein